MTSTDHTTVRERTGLSARAVLALCVVAALVLLAGLVVVTSSPDRLRALGASGSCGGWSDDEIGRDETRMSAGFVIRNPMDRPVTLRGVSATWDARIRSVHIVLAEKVRGSGTGAIYGNTADVIEGARVLEADGAVIAPHHDVRVVAEMRAVSMAHGGHLTGLRVVTRGPLGTLQTQDLSDVTLGMTTPRSDSC